jgi:hypothetical protein
MSRIRYVEESERGKGVWELLGHDIFPIFTVHSYRGSNRNRKRLSIQHCSNIQSNNWNIQGRVDKGLKKYKANIFGQLGNKSCTKQEKKCVYD